MRFKKYIGIAIGLAIIVVLVLKSDFKEVFKLIAGIDKLYLALALIIFFFVTLLRSLRWKTFIQTKISYMYVLKATSLGILANRILPSRLGALLRAILITKKSKYKIGYSLGSVFLDNIIVVLFVSISSAIVASKFLINESRMIGQLIIWPLIFVAALIVALFIIYYILKSKFFIKIISKIRKLENIRKKYGTGMLVDFKNYFFRFKIKRLFLGLLITAPIWVGVSVVNFMILKSLNLSIGIAYLYLASGLPFIIGMITLIPGGFGTQELSMVGILISAGLPAYAATSVALLSRFIDLFWTILFGIYASFTIKIRDIKSEQNEL